MSSWLKTAKPYSGTVPNTDYVYYKDLMGGPQPKTPEEAIAMQEMGKFEKREIPLCAAMVKRLLVHSK